MEKKITNRFILLITLIILLIVLAVAFTIRTEFPRVYLDETISTMGKFVESLISFLKK